MGLFEVITNGELIAAQINSRTPEVEKNLKLLRYDNIAQYVLDSKIDWEKVRQSVWDAFFNHHNDVVRMQARTKYNLYVNKF